MELQKVQLEHASGATFNVFLTNYEVSRAQNDSAFRGELINKYWKLHHKNLVLDANSVNEPTADEHFLDEEVVSQETEFYLGTPSSTNENSQRYLWPREAVLQLLAELREVQEELQTPHKNRLLFGKIAEKLKRNGYPVTWEIVERKWRGLQSTYRNMLKKENKSGSGSSSWEFYDKVAEIVSGDPSHFPPTTISVGVTPTIIQNNEDEEFQTPKRRKNNPTKSNSNQSDRDQWIRGTLTIINNNVTNLHNSITRLTEIQENRNAILNRMASCFEKFIENRD